MARLDSVFAWSFCTLFSARILSSGKFVVTFCISISEQEAKSLEIL